jgi:hypothetical protein
MASSVKVSGVLDRVFLRLYAFDLGRNFRNTPEKACNDAIMQTSIVLTTPLIIIGCVVASFIPGAVSHIQRSDAPFVFTVIGGVVPLVYLVNRRFTRFRTMPEAAEPYRGARERAKTIAGYVVFPLLVLGVFFYLVYLFR